MKTTDNQPIEISEPLNEESTLREEESRAKYDRRMEELDRRDKAGTHWIHRG